VHRSQRPRTGFPELNFPAFNNMAAHLRDAGQQVINPAELDHTSNEWADCLHLDIIHLMSCDDLATLPGWQSSKGVRLDVYIALEFGMTVVNIHDLLLVETAGS
jgi:hypothetical protein